MTLGANYDYDLQKQQQERRQAMVNALQAQAMRPMDIPTAGAGQVQQRANPILAIGAPLIQALMANKMQGDLKQDQQELSNRYKQDLVSGMEKYIDTSQGTEPIKANIPGMFGMEDRSEVIAPGTKADPKKAMLEALASNHPVLQQLGMSQLAAMGKKEGLSKKDLLSLSGFDAKSKIAAALAGDESLLIPETKEHVVNNQIVSGIPGQAGSYKPVGDFRDTFQAPGQVAVGAEGKPIFGQTEKTTGKVTFAPAGTNVTVDTGAKAGQAFAKQLGEKRADILTKSYEKAQEASNSLQALNAAAEDFDKGIKSGAPAEIALGLSKWGKALGLGEADPAIANTEAFRANMAQQVLSSVKALGSGTGISNADRDYAEKAAGGAITLDDQAMYRLMNIARASAANALISHHSLLEKNMNASGAVPEDIETFRVPFSIPVGDALDWSPSTGKVIVRSTGPAAPKPGKPSNAPIPGQTKPAAGGAISWQDYLKSQGM